MEVRALRTNYLINRQQDYQPPKLGSPRNNDNVKKENWKLNDEKNNNQLRNYERQMQIGDQSYNFLENRQMDKDQNNHNTSLKQSYYYEQLKPSTAIYQSREDKSDQIYIKKDERQKIQDQIAHSYDKYSQKLSEQPFGNRTPMDLKSNLSVTTPLDRDNQNKYKIENQFSGLKRDFKLPEYQRMYPELTRNKNNQYEKSNQKDQESKLEQNGFLDIEKRLQERREQVEKITGQYEGKLNYYSKSQEYQQKQQNVGLDNNQDKMKQFQEELRNEVRDRIKEKSNQQYKQDYRTVEINQEKKIFEKDVENKQYQKEILELDQFKSKQLEEKYKQLEETYKVNNDQKNNYNEYSRQDQGINFKRQQLNEKSPYQSRFNPDSKYQQRELGKYHFNQNYEIDTRQRQEEKTKYVDRSLQCNKSQNEEKIRSDLRSEGSIYKQSQERLDFKEKLNCETLQRYQTAKREIQQSEEIQRRLNLYDKLQNFDLGNEKKYQDGQIYQAHKTSNISLKQEMNQYDQKQQTSVGYNFDKYDTKKQEKQIQQFDNMEFKRAQFQPEINQIKLELEKKYGLLKPEIDNHIKDFDNRRIFENRYRPEPIQAKIAGAREYLGQKYYQREPYRTVQRHSYHQESSIQDRLGAENGSSKNNVNNKAIDDILQGTALSKYIEKEKNQNKIPDRITSFTNSKIGYQKSPLVDKQQYASYDRLSQQQRGFGNDRYVLVEDKLKKTSDQNLQKYCSPTGFINKQFGNYDRKDRRI